MTGSQTIHVVRHATAGRRTFSNDDLSRPLDTFGQAQARQLVQLLGNRGIAAVHSSRATRCQQTVAPLAAHLGLDVQVASALLEGSSIARVLDFVRDEVVPTGEAAVLCSHGDVIPDLIRTLEVSGMRITGERRFTKGSVWELSYDADGRFTDAFWADVVPTPSPA